MFIYAMSLNIVPTQIVKTEYPKVKITNGSERKYAVLKGAGEVSYQRFPSTSISNNQIQWSCNPPGPNFVIDRLVWVRMNFTINFAGTGGSVGDLLLKLGSLDALRALPISTICNTQQVTINNDQVSTNTNMYWAALARYHSYMANKDKFLSKTPCFLDTYQEYNPAINYSAGVLGPTGVPGTIGQNNRNPLAGYDNSPVGQLGRGAFDYTVLSNGQNAASVNVTVTEPLWLSPFLFSEFDFMESGLIGVNNMNVVLTLNLSRIWSHADQPITVPAKPVLTSITPTLNSADLLFCYYTPNITDPIPTQISWPYFEIVPYPSRIGTLTARGSPTATNSTTATMNAVQLKQIPTKMYIFARERDADINSGSNAWKKTGDSTYAGITQLNVTFGNRTGLLATASQQDLYEMSRKNGLDMNWSEFTGVACVNNSGNYAIGPNQSDLVKIGTIGSVVCVAFGQDLGLDALSAPGLMVNVQLSLQATIYNPNAFRDINYDLFVVIVNEGTISLVNGSFMHQLGVFSSQDVLNSNSPGFPVVPFALSQHVYGGAFWDKVKSFFGKVGDTLKSVAPWARKALTAAAPLLGAPGRAVGIADTALKALGAGYGGVLVGGRRRAPMRRRRVRGGKLISRSELKDRMEGGIESDGFDDDDVTTI